MNIKNIMIIVSILYLSALAVHYFDTIEKERIKIEKQKLNNKKINDSIHETIEDLDFCEKEEPKREENEKAVKFFKNGLKLIYSTARRDKTFVLDHQSEEGIKKYLGEKIMEKDK